MFCDNYFFEDWSCAVCASGPGPVVRCGLFGSTSKTCSSTRIVFPYRCRRWEPHLPAGTKAAPYFTVTPLQKMHRPSTQFHKELKFTHNLTWIDWWGKEREEQRCGERGRFSVLALTSYWVLIRFSHEWVLYFYTIGQENKRSTTLWNVCVHFLREGTLRRWGLSVRDGGGEGWRGEGLPKAAMTKTGSDIIDTRSNKNDRGSFWRLTEEIIPDWESERRGEKRDS